MSENVWRDRLIEVPAVLWRAEADALFVSGAQNTVWMAIESGQLEAVTWLPFHRVEVLAEVRVGRAVAIDISDPIKGRGVVLVDWREERGVCVLDQVPECVCPFLGAVKQVVALVRGVESESLRRFVESAFRIPDVFKYFWTCPASIANHHAFAGGLVMHSLEIAVSVSVIEVLKPWERDLAIVYALLHDLGKLWSYEGGTFTPEAAALGHEAIGFNRLLPALKVLRDDSPVLGEHMHDLLLGDWKRDYRHPAAALGGIVRAMDRFSANRSKKNPKRTVASI